MHGGTKAPISACQLFISESPFIFIAAASSLEDEYGRMHLWAFLILNFVHMCEEIGACGGKLEGTESEGFWLWKQPRREARVMGGRGLM